MTVQMKLKRKYLIGKKSKYKGGENYADKKHRSKIGEARHQALYGVAPVMVRHVDGATGKSRMERSN
jgi:hypothetical protein